MRSNSGRGESRNNLRDPALGERSIGRGTIKSGKKPKAPADHREGQQDKSPTRHQTTH